MANQTITKTAFWLTLIIAFAKVLGFLRELVIAYVFGASAVTDAYTIAATMTLTASLLVMVYITTTFVPSYIKIRQANGEASALGFTNDALRVSIIISIVIMAIFQLGTPLIISFTGFDAEHSQFAIVALRIALFKLPLFACIHLFSGYLSARHSFVGPNFIGIPLSITVIAIALILGTYSGIIGLSVASLLGVASQLVVLCFWLPKEKYRFKLYQKFGSNEIKNGMLLMLPAFIGQALMHLWHWTDTIVATHLYEGTAAAIGFATRILTLITGLILMPISGIVFTYMSEQVVKEDKEKAAKVLLQSIGIVIFVFLPIIVIGILFSTDIVRIVYQRGQFTDEAVATTGTALAWYLPSLIGTALTVLALRFFYGIQDTKTPLVCAAAAIPINIGMTILLANAMGIAGIALAGSIGGILQGIVLVYNIRRKVGMLKLSIFAKDLVKMLVAALICGSLSFSAGYVLSAQSSVIRFIVSAAVGVVVYLVFSLMLKINVIHIALSYRKSRK